MSVEFQNTVVLPLSRPDFKPFLIQALLDWCEDKGFTPYMLVAVDDSVQVPAAYVNPDHTIVLCISSEATSKFQIDDKEISFLTRFGEQVEQIVVPMERVAAVYPKENTELVSYFEVRPVEPRPADHEEPTTPIFKKV